jgi:phosphoribosylanthranilate isomerase
MKLKLRLWAKKQRKVSKPFYLLKMAIKLKVCGMKYPDNITELSALQPDYMGFIFYRPSKRFVGNLDQAITTSLPSTIKATGVFVDEDLDDVVETAKKFGLRAFQLHGSESAGYCRALKAILPDIELIKAFGINESFSFDILDDYQNGVDYFLFDTQTAAHGGSGKTFNWQLLSRYKLQKPYFLSGGIGMEEVTQIKEIMDPRLYAIDVNSRFETAAAVKDIKQLKTFKNQLLSTAQ